MSRDVRYLRCLGGATVLLVSAVAGACATVPQGDAGPSAVASPVGSLQEGTYANCTGAYAHGESLWVSAGEFQHSIVSHGVFGGRSTGTYEVIGDTVVVEVDESVRLRDDTRDAPALAYDFVIGEYAGLPVLWRGTDAGTRSVAETGTMSEYAALFFGGPEPGMYDDIPSCAEVRERLRGPQREP